MGTRKIARPCEGASTSQRLVLRNYSNQELCALAQSHPWPVHGRKGNRVAQKALAEAMDQLTDQAFSVAFNASLAESYRLKYPLRTAHFTRMFFRAMNKQIDLRIRGSGVRS